MNYDFINKRFFLAAAITWVILTNSAEAQLLKPRCGGWPAPMDGSSEGLLIGYEGEICYGEVIGKLKVLESIGNVSISRGPTKGKAYMVGETSFAYQPSPSLQGYDELAIQFIVESNGRKERRETKLRATSLRYYKSAGGTESNPPPGVGVTRYGIAPGSGGAQGRINY